MNTRSPRPDPEVRRLLVQLSTMRPPTAARPVAVATIRRYWQLAVKAFASREPVARVSDHNIPGPAGPLRLRAYHPREDRSTQPVLVWFHGGGFVFGDIYTAGATCRALANRSGAIVVAVEYRLAPEHPLEAGRADCVAATQWLTEHAGELGGDPTRVAVGGDSAGGGLAALVAQICARNGIRLAGQVLVYPATDLTGDHAYASEAMPGLLTPAWMNWIRAQIFEVSDLADPAGSAIRTRDLSGLAPAVVLTAGFDPLRDEGFVYAERLRTAGVVTRHLHYPGQIHGFLTFDRVLTGGRHALDRIGTELAHAFDGQLSTDVELDLPPRRRANHLLWMRPAQRRRELGVFAALLSERLIRRRRKRMRLFNADQSSNSSQRKTR